jgi:hypothetical protein
MAKKCSVTGCDVKYRAKGLCATHWKINKKYGTPTPLCWCGEPAQTNAGNHGISVECKQHTLITRFWDNVNVGSDDECWEWQGSRTEAGYGLMWYDGKLRYAHRIAIDLEGDLFACHKCDNPPCVNPNHLFVGTQKDNVQDMLSKGRARGRNS